MSISYREQHPRLPLDGRLDLTYRCNNRCRHCWLWLPETAPQAQQELSIDEIRRIVDQARSMGCQAWAISGGEPMLRADFAEIFDYITRRSISYRLNTNGTLITPPIARLLTRRGRVMVVLYGATAEVSDHVTRSPGSFEATMQGFAYLREAGADFIVQIVPMGDNYHQYDEMLALAESLSPHYRVGAPWLWLSACRSETRNREIKRQRLDPDIVISLDEPDPSGELFHAAMRNGPAANRSPCGAVREDDDLFGACIDARRDFHIDPYGGMSFCCYIKDPALRYDLRAGTFQQAWDEFIPSLAGTVLGGEEYRDSCGSCDLRDDCRWCAVYGYLEHGRYAARVDYLCRVAEQTRRFKDDWKREHLRYYRIGGITIQLTTSFPLCEDTFVPKFKKFQVDGPGEDTISLRLVSPVPALSDLRLGREVFRRPPWLVYRQPNSWIYLGVSSDKNGRDPFLVGIFDEDYRRLTICREPGIYQRGNLHSLSSLTSDQILLAHILADRQGLYMHAAGISIDGKGLLFVGHSGVGKSTILKMLRGQGKILCDDRIIVRRWSDGFHIHGTWSHGELPEISPDGAPLQVILFLEQADQNELIPITGKQEQLGRVLSHIVKPLPAADWWEKTLDLAGMIAAEVPIYRLRFDTSGRVSEELNQLL